MAVQPRRDRTREIVRHYEIERDRLGIALDSALSNDDVSSIEALIREAIRLLREIKAECVREERRDAERIGGTRWAQTATIDLGYEQEKHEIDRAIETLHAEKVELRTAKANQPEIDLTPAAVSDESHEKLIRLLDLHQMGVLTSDEFAAARQRLK